MTNFLRTHSQKVLTFVAVIVTVSFVWFYNRYDPSLANRNFVAEAAGQRLTRDDFMRYIRMQGVAADMGLIELTEALSIGPTRRPDQDFVFNLLTLRSSAEACGISPSPEEIRQAQLELPVFQDDQGRFDPVRLSGFIEQSVTPRGFTERQIDDLVADLIRYRTLQRLVSATVPVSPAQVEREVVRRETRHSVSVIKFDLAKFKKEVNPSEEEIKQLYEQEKKNLQSEEQRKVRVAALTLTPEQAKLEGKERIQALQTLANRSYEFSQAVLEPGANFEALATAGGFKMSETGTFTPSKLDPAIENIPGASSAIEGLTPENPVSDVVQGETSFYVLQLLAHTPSHPLTLDEARAKLTEHLVERQAREKLQKVAAIERVKIEETIRTGKSFDEAATALGLKPEALTPFSISEPPIDKPELANVFEAAVQLPMGALSPLIPAKDGALIACVTRREPPVEDVRQSRTPDYATRIERAREETAFAEWLRLQRDIVGAKFLATQTEG